MIKVFFDVEFTELRLNAEIISIGAVSEFGDTFYAESTDYNHELVNDWIKENVLVNLDVDPSTNRLEPVQGRYNHLPDGRVEYWLTGPVRDIGLCLKHWFNDLCDSDTASFKQTQVEMWSDCLAYDWVLFNSMYGGALNVPDCVYYIPFDICTLFKVVGIDPDINREEFVDEHYITCDGKKHNALHDAEIIKSCYEILQNKLKEKKS